MAAGFLGLTSSILDVHMFRKAAVCRQQALLAAGAGFIMGLYVADNMSSMLKWRTFDPEIVMAYDQRYLQKSLNAAGYHNNWVSFSHSRNNPFPKPY